MNKQISAYIRLSNKRAYLIKLQPFIQIDQLYHSVANHLRINTYDMLIVTRGKILTPTLKHLEKHKNIQRQQLTSLCRQHQSNNNNNILKVQQRQIFHIIMYSNIDNFPLLRLNVKILIKIEEFQCQCQSEYQKQQQQQQTKINNISNFNSNREIKKQNSRLSIQEHFIQGVDKQLTIKQFIAQYINNLPVTINVDIKQAPQQSSSLFTYSHPIIISLIQLRQLIKQQLVIIYTGRELSIINDKTLIEEYVENGSEIVVTFRKPITFIDCQLLFMKRRQLLQSGNNNINNYSNEHLDRNRLCDQQQQRITTTTTPVQNNDNNYNDPLSLQSGQVFNPAVIIDPTNSTTNISSVQQNQQQIDQSSQSQSQQQQNHDNVFKCSNNLFISVRDTFQSQQYNKQLQNIKQNQTHSQQSLTNNINQNDHNNGNYIQNTQNTSSYTNSNNKNSNDMSINYIPPEIINSLNLQQHYHNHQQINQSINQITINDNNYILSNQFQQIIKTKNKFQQISQDIVQQQQYQIDQNYQLIHNTSKKDILSPSSQQLIPQPVTNPSSQQSISIKDSLKQIFMQQNLINISSILLKQNTQHIQQISNRQINMYVQSFNGNLLDIDIVHFHLNNL